MKAIPKKLKIGPINYRVVEVGSNGVATDDPHTWGFVDFSTCVIRLYRDLPMDKKWAVLMHEIVHAIDEQSGLELNEANTDRLAVSLVDTLTRNKLGLL